MGVKCGTEIINLKTLNVLSLIDVTQLFIKLLLKIAKPMDNLIILQWAMFQMLD